MVRILAFNAGDCQLFMFFPVQPWWFEAYCEYLPPSNDQTSQIDTADFQTSAVSNIPGQTKQKCVHQSKESDIFSESKVSWYLINFVLGKKKAKVLFLYETALRRDEGGISRSEGDMFCG